jgi:hypothetical protein
VLTGIIFLNGTKSVNRACVSTSVSNSDKKPQETNKMMSRIRIFLSLPLKLYLLKSVSSSSIHDYTKQNYGTIWKALQIRLFASIPESKEEVIKKDTTVKGGFKQIWNRYGTYAGLYITTLGSIFISLDLDVFNAATFGFDPKTAVLKVILTSIFV